jgi:hypothetical protein
MIINMEVGAGISKILNAVVNVHATAIVLQTKAFCLHSLNVQALYTEHVWMHHFVPDVTIL